MTQKQIQIIAQTIGVPEKNIQNTTANTICRNFATKPMVT